MKIIGKRSKETTNSRNNARVTVYNINIYLTKTALAEFDIKKGDKVKFMADNGLYAFYKTDKADKDAYSVTVTAQGGGEIKSRGLVRFFREEFLRPTGGFSFFLRRMDSEVKGNPLIELRTDVIYTYKANPHKKQQNVSSNVS